MQSAHRLRPARRRPQTPRRPTDPHTEVGACAHARHRATRGHGSRHRRLEIKPLVNTTSTCPPPSEHAAQSTTFSESSDGPPHKSTRAPNNNTSGAMAAVPVVAAAAPEMPWRTEAAHRRSQAPGGCVVLPVVAPLPWLWWHLRLLHLVDMLDRVSQPSSNLLSAMLCELGRVARGTHATLVEVQIISFKSAPRPAFQSNRALLVH